jgi:hypothetical protein
MKFQTLADWTGKLETELFAETGGQAAKPLTNFRGVAG